jgi:hypothetical protein
MHASSIYLVISNCVAFLPQRAVERCLHPLHLLSQQVQVHTVICFKGLYTYIKIACPTLQIGLSVTNPLKQGVLNRLNRGVNWHFQTHWQTRNSK